MSSMWKSISCVAVSPKRGGETVTTDEQIKYIQREARYDKGYGKKWYNYSKEEIADHIEDIEIKFKDRGKDEIFKLICELKPDGMSDSLIIEMYNGYRGGYVYFAIPLPNQTEREFVKIGMTKRQKPLDRINNFQTPFKLCLLGYITVAHRNIEKVEKIIHEMFKINRLNGEWFEINYENVKSQITENIDKLNISVNDICFNNQEARK